MGKNIFNDNDDGTTWGELNEVDLESDAEGDALSRKGGDASRKEGPKPLGTFAVIFIFFVMAILSAVIGIVLWYFIHP